MEVIFQKGLRLCRKQNTHKQRTISSFVTSEINWSYELKAHLLSTNTVEEILLKILESIISDSQSCKKRQTLFKSQEIEKIFIKNI